MTTSDVNNIQYCTCDKLKDIYDIYIIYEQIRKQVYSAALITNDSPHPKKIQELPAGPMSRKWKLCDINTHARKHWFRTYAGTKITRLGKGKWWCLAV